ncbi:universal stress protein [Mucilaginibacter sp.]|jgi:nucleotide-binding universal stress UspA family protein|uniref:universal stress protein n=1 Tax=Mucilaginibacter sp. TaxID=1882438 RepID=UPI002C8BDB83|nr:universal stress protein [Mucilaginibacter sp.]HTI61284.1 universal stress protein [Mucilaginibacter sp.]
MKTIAVLTDFSARAEHAARYALHLAKKVKANILLYNAFLVPSDTPMAAQVAWPMVDYNEIKSDTEKTLKALAKKLEAELKEDHFPGTFLPAVSYQCDEGSIANNITGLEENGDISLLVLATHGSDEISAFMFGNNCRQVIGSANTPVLIVPEKTPLSDIEKIAFATDITYTDVEYVKSLSKLAEKFGAEITITNVNPDNPLDSEHNAAVRLFMDDIEHDVDYRKITFKSVPGSNVKKGLEWLIENIKFDLLVMVHRKSTMFELLFRPSVTKKIAGRVDIPLLVYPYPAVSMPLI